MHSVHSCKPSASVTESLGRSSDCSSSSSDASQRRGFREKGRRRLSDVSREGDERQQGMPAREINGRGLRCKGKRGRVDERPRDTVRQIVRQEREEQAWEGGDARSKADRANTAQELEDSSDNKDQGGRHKETERCREGGARSSGSRAREGESHDDDEGGGREERRAVRVWQHMSSQDAATTGGCRGYVSQRRRQSDTLFPRRQATSWCATTVGRQ